MIERTNEQPKRALVNNLCPGLRLKESQIERLIEVLDRDGAFDAPAGELSIAFVSKKEIARLHADFMDDPTPTDVITFPGDPDIELAGEICVCPEVARDYAQRERLDFSEELSLYVIHGYLHLCGFDDIEESDRAEMRRAEKLAMQIARAANALPTFTLG
ncbi:rRNA maturation RNase YbeY [Pelagicoccus sp. SDUM812003]|uniref:rRNA maturation RNase YbeY n=1 Tax=Pelagicoccus sp. SDUM812003 TaxID=3041267 RepID=UPI00280DFD46|nr:rRNA maturation RNase YbeY [Pelagicoccus sp. SDUM812003]MDQ8202820.1 rRNA maturation RNase YbeY [Pelagicoccus sp. SDUM812003]